MGQRKFVLKFFEIFFSDYQMVKSFRQFKTIFGEFGQFFELQISDLNVRGVKKHPVYSISCSKNDKYRVQIVKCTGLLQIMPNIT